MPRQRPSGSAFVAARHRLWLALADRRCFAWLLPRLSRGDVQHVSRNTDLVVEGFPRSGNTFLYSLIVAATRSDARIAHHTHGVAAFRLASRWKIPCVIVVREPAPAVASLCRRHPGLAPETGWRRYVVYHESLLEMAEELVIVDFRNLVSDPVRVLSALDECFGGALLHDWDEQEIIGEARRHAWQMHEQDGGRTVDRRHGAGLRVDGSAAGVPANAPGDAHLDEGIAVPERIRRRAETAWRKLVDRVPAPGEPSGAGARM